MLWCHRFVFFSFAVCFLAVVSCYQCCQFFFSLAATQENQECFKEYITLEKRLSERYR